MSTNSFAKRKSLSLRVFLTVTALMIVNALVIIGAGVTVYGGEGSMGYFITVALISVVIIGPLIHFSIMRCFNYVLGRLRKNIEAFTTGELHFGARNQEDVDGAGELYTSFGKMAEVYSMLIADFKHMVAEHVSGHYDVRIDQNKYRGDFAELVKNINDMTFMYVDDTLELLKVIDQYGKGNFNAEVRRYEENWSWANDVMDDFRENLKHVIDEVNMISKAAHDGNFKITIDAGNAQGEWKHMFITMNKFIKNINEPLSEIENNVVIMSQGDFSPLEGEFHGVFKNLQDSCNLTNKRSEQTINEIARILEAIAEGDLTVKGHEGIVYEPIREAIGTILTSFNKSMKDIALMAKQLDESSDVLEINAGSLADGINVQASSVEEMHAMMEIMTENAASNSENAGKAAVLSKESDDYARNGDRDMKDMLVAMGKIKDSSANISKVIKVIEDIAFQTNLLALNASVEAARAGEHGKSFAVVADEVRTLASRSHVAVKDTTELIEDSINKVDSGLKNVGDVGKALATIVTDVSQVTDMITKIAGTSDSQSRSIEQALIGIAGISEVVQSNAKASDQCSTVSKEVAEQARVLKRMVSAYRLRDR